MFSKTIIALSTALVLATAFAATAQAQERSKQRDQAMPGYTEFEKLWFKLGQGDEH